MMQKTQDRVPCEVPSFDREQDDRDTWRRFVAMHITQKSKHGMIVKCLGNRHRAEYRDEDLQFHKIA